MNAINSLPGTSLLFPESNPFDEGFVEVGDGHALHYARFGNPNGVPVVILHGGPGSGWRPMMPRYFDPEKWNILCFSQRGAGQSTPSAETLAGLENNTTAHCIADIETLRQHFGVEKWAVQGHSWGSTLGVAYAEAHPERVAGLIVSGIFYMENAGMLFHYQTGAEHLFPEMRADYEDFIPKEERNDMVAAYHKRIMVADHEKALEACLHWNRWERMCSWVVPQSEDFFRTDMPDDVQLKVGRIENHYFQNRCFMDDGALIKNADKLKDIPGAILHGRFDVVAPASGAHKLHKAWPKADFHLIPGANHVIPEVKAYTEALLEAIDKLLVHIKG